MIIELIKYTAKVFWEAIPFPKNYAGETNNLKKAIAIGGTAIGLMAVTLSGISAFNNRTRHNRVESSDISGRLVDISHVYNEGKIDPRRSSFSIVDDKDRTLTNKFVALPSYDDGKIIPSITDWNDSSLQEVERLYENMGNSLGSRITVNSVKRLEDDLSSPIAISPRNVRY